MLVLFLNYTYKRYREAFNKCTLNWIIYVKSYTIIITCNLFYIKIPIIRGILFCSTLQTCLAEDKMFIS